MPNKQGFLNRQEASAAKAKGKAILVPPGEWRGTPPQNCLLLTRSRCEAYGSPVESGEIPAAYGYTEQRDDEYRYVPLFARYPGMIDIEQLEPIHRRQMMALIT